MQAKLEKFIHDFGMLFVGLFIFLLLTVNDIEVE